MKNFLKSDLALQILSLLIAIGLWFYVVQVQSPEIEQTITDVPVVFTQKDVLESRNLSLLKDKEHTIDIKVRGQRKTIIEVNNKNITVTADVGQIQSAGIHTVATNVVLPVGGLEIIKKSPATIEIEVDELARKEIDVTYQLLGTPMADHVIGDVMIDPKTVTVSGPKTVLDGISALQVGIDVEGKDADVTAVTELKMLGTNEKEINSPYVTLTSNTVQISCQILKTKTVGLRPNLSSALLLADQAYELDPGSVDAIRIAGPAEVLDQIDSVNTEAIYELSDNMVQVGVRLPTGVHSLDGDKFNLRFVNKTKGVKTVAVSNIGMQGLAADMTAEITSQAVEVTLIGSADVLARAGTPSAVVNLTGLSPGSHSVPLRLAYMKNVWTDREYYVEVTIRQND